MVVLDKLDYCASVHNLDAVKESHNFEVRSLLLFRDCSLIYGDRGQLINIPSAAAKRCKAAAQLVKGDIQSADLIGHLLRQHEVDTVMHFAAQVSPPFSPHSCAHSIDRHYHPICYHEHLDATAESGAGICLLSMHQHVFGHGIQQLQSALSRFKKLDHVLCLLCERNHQSTLGSLHWLPRG